MTIKYKFLNFDRYQFNIDILHQTDTDMSIRVYVPEKCDFIAGERFDENSTKYIYFQGDSYIVEGESFPLKSIDEKYKVSDITIRSATEVDFHLKA